MMNTHEDSQLVRNTLREQGVSDEVAGRVRFMRDNAEGHDGEMRATLEFTYQRTKRGITGTAVCASVNIVADTIGDLLSNRRKLATFLDRAMRATPAVQRADLPAWVAMNSDIAMQDAARAKANSLARAAIA